MLSKHCVYCGAVHQKRGYFCSPECERALNNQKRAERAEKKCRLCGRVFRRPRTKREQEGAVLTEHTPSEELSGCQM